MKIKKTIKATVGNIIKHKSEYFYKRFGYGFIIEIVKDEISVIWGILESRSLYTKTYLNNMELITDVFKV